MQLNHGLHLAYCTNIHRGESWPEIFASLEENTMAVRDRVCPGRYGIGLRLSDVASRQLLDRDTLLDFQRWLDRKNCYVFTINGFPFGRFHGSGVKDQVYLPDWTSPERLEYTNRLFDLLAQLLPLGVEGSVSTLPGSFKEFTSDPAQSKAIRSNLVESVKHIARLNAQSHRVMHLGLEPEPLCLLETSTEVTQFFDQIRSENPQDLRIDQCLGINYDTCHLAVEFEEPLEAISRLCQHGIKISKIHLSSALEIRPTPEACNALRAFNDKTYLHQVVVQDPEGRLTRFKDLPDALQCLETSNGGSIGDPKSRWRIHFHVPLHSPPAKFFGNTTQHLLGVLDLLRDRPGLCSHLEMETYTWEVMPLELKNRSVIDQLAFEYDWTLREMRQRGLAG